MRGEALYHSRRYAEAISDYFKAISLNNDIQDIIFYLQLLNDHGDRVKCIKEANKVLLRQPELAEIYELRDWPD